ncbi:ADP-glyceromanno-heptose 6-epimerase [Pontibacter cellulosilyticus]|uniref:ADP-L-glycero-D-manno-heptose-6-epimerase n=1 Tax=Pontibacter cellulosilyticus TaxID=1720253 RepID=A0A923N9H7_9BACT|nr:ADP-glyceromanno-heptose 6-epimerase [Pontibacter cellulosilyticus]MBC5993362.1 ADP-glyceromanno-heptose 6-epimerase [Pontibacter cellulosilyticus]
MIVVTGAAGFIASCLVSRLNQANFNDIVVVDNFSVVKKESNLKGKNIKEYVDRDGFFEWLDENYEEVEFIFHLGARTDTTEFNKDVFDLLNLNYSKKVWNACCEYQIPLVYASSAATYGSGTLGYDDDEATIPLLKPLNPYGESKNDFDIWALQQTAKPFFWAGLKFFNVYGPNEYHKGKMASVIFHAYNQIKEKGSMKLFRSHHPDFADGEQMRDFVYVKDVVEVCMFLMRHRKNSGIYNLGSGKARTFMALALNTFEAMGVTPEIDFMDTPENLRDNYQYFTEANMSNLRSIGYDRPFYTLEEGVKDYVQNYLIPGKYY